MYTNTNSVECCHSKELPAKGYQHFSKSAMKDQISLGNQLLDQNILQPGMWKKEIITLTYQSYFVWDQHRHLEVLYHKNKY